MTLNSESLTYSCEKILDGPLVISPTSFSDERGFFMESWNLKEWEKVLEKHNQPNNGFVQDNHSKSSKGVLRGLHYQKNPFAQDKLVRCTRGEIFDVGVDIRINSPTFGKWVGVFLTAENKKQLWVPAGFAHGFLTLSNIAEVQYKTTNFYQKSHEGVINFSDKNINILWPKDSMGKSFNYELSEKDKNAPFLNDLSKEDLF